MLVHEVMTTDPATVPAGASVKQALGILAEHRITSLPVITASGTVVGIVSEADLIRELLDRDPRAHEIPQPELGRRARLVEEVMSRHVVVVRPDTDLADAIELLTSTAVKSLPVVDPSGRLRGIVSRSDVVRMLAREDDKIEAEIDELIRSAGLEGWLVDVHDGSVSLLGPDDESDADLARLLARTVTGVLDVSTRKTP